MPTHIKFSKKDACIGCKLCELACSVTRLKEFNPARANLHISWKFQTPEKEYEISGLKVSGKTCNRCDKCVKACGAGAISEVDGVLKVDEDKCTGCNICGEACPQGVIVFPRKYPSFCNLCEGNPQCIEWCPYGVLEVMTR